LLSTIFYFLFGGGWGRGGNTFFCNLLRGKKKEGGKGTKGFFFRKKWAQVTTLWGEKKFKTLFCPTLPRPTIPLWTSQWTTDLHLSMACELCQTLQRKLSVSKQISNTKRWLLFYTTTPRACFFIIYLFIYLGGGRGGRKGEATRTSTIKPIPDFSHLPFTG